MKRIRIPLVAGNWKMNKGPAAARAFAEELLRQVTNDQVEMNKAGGVEVAVFPPFTALPAVADILKGTPISYGGQNGHWEPSGAFTGETAPAFLAELGCRYVLVGHSERRTMFAETDETCGKKLLAVVAAGMEPILCCGETLSERESSLTFKVIERQLQAALAGLSPAVLFAVAYEPVWAIGTGRAATGQMAQDVIGLIRRTLAEQFAAEAEAVRIQYGGSVTAANVAEFLAQPDVDGGLVGGASLKADEFVAIVQATARVKGVG